MAHGLPDYYSSMEASLTKAINLTNGLDAEKSASPSEGDVYVATDTGKVYVCYTTGTWTHVTAAYLLLAGGTMSGAIAMGTNKITGLGDPTLDQDAATKIYADTLTGLALSSKLITASRAAATASGDVSYTGVGFEPAAIICLTQAANTTTPQYSIGFADADLAEMCIYRAGNLAYGKVDTTRIIRSDDADGAAGQGAALLSMDADGFTLTWVKYGTPGYATTLIFLCMR